jgi:uroporphyrinogen decarboxylase
LNHREADKVPVDFGGWQSGISYESYEPLKDYLGLTENTRLEEAVQGLAWVDEAVLDRFEVDTRYIFPNNEVDDEYRQKGSHGFTDAWGIEWFRPESSHYYDISRSPLAEAETKDLARYPWPTGKMFFDQEEVRKHLQPLKGSDCALFTCLAGVFEQATYIRGMARFYMDIYDDTGFFEALMDRVLEAELDIYGDFFEIVGEHLDVVQIWGDLGSQQGPLISPAHYQKYVMDREAALVEFVKKHTGARVALHSCGSVHEFIPDIIETGYEVLNPIQTNAAGMDPVRLKKEFGSDIVFWGGVDTQRVLPFGTEDEVRDEVRRLIEILAPGGGYILAPCHNIQANTPPENIAMLFNAAGEFGTYGL